MAEITDLVRITGVLAEIGSIDGLLSDKVNISASLSIPEFVNSYYEGDYQVTATDEAQIISTQGLVMRDNLTINPIPSNYGKITWNGSTLTVS